MELSAAPTAWPERTVTTERPRRTRAPAGPADLEVWLAVRSYQAARTKERAAQPAPAAAHLGRRSLDDRRLDADEHVLDTPSGADPGDVGGDVFRMQRLHRRTHRDRARGCD